jgi:hypothetical protein
MKRFFYFFTTSLLLISCNNNSSRDKYTEYITKQDSKDTTTSEILKSGDFSNSIFGNEITFKDGQSNKAGISFIMQIDTSKYLVSAKHLMGQDGGFKDSLKSDNISELLLSWKVQSTSSSLSFSVNTNETTKNDGDVLIFNSIIGGDNLKTFKLSKLILPTTMDGKFDLKNSPSNFYLIGYLPTGKEILHNLTLAGKYQEYFVFKKNKEFDYHGLSGGPILDNKGNVFGILTGGLDDNGKELVLVSRIRPRNLK